MQRPIEQKQNIKQATVLHNYNHLRTEYNLYIGIVCKVATLSSASRPVQTLLVY